MCIIIMAPPLSSVENEIPNNYLHNSWIKNRDGGGLCYVKNIGKDNAEVKICKGFFKFSSFKKCFKEARRNNQNSWFVIHFRYASMGEVNVKNCHPFFVSGGVAMAHNGTLFKLNSQKNIGLSDTNLLAQILKDMPKNWIDNDVYLNLIQNYIGPNNKIAFLTKNNDVHYLNPNKWITENGFLFSNDYYKEDNNTNIKSFPINTEQNFNIESRCYKCGCTSSRVKYFCGVYYCEKCFNTIDKLVEVEQINAFNNSSIYDEDYCDCGKLLQFEDEVTRKKCFSCQKSNIYEEFGDV